MKCQIYKDAVTERYEYCGLSRRDLYIEKQALQSTDGRYDRCYVHAKDAVTAVCSLKMRSLQFAFSLSPDAGSAATGGRGQTDKRTGRNLL